jgi:glycosyltransferase involved in cell wall biosynthesis
MEVHIATPPDDASEKIGAHGFSFHPISMSRSGVNPLREIRTFGAIVRLLRSVRPDVLHSVAIKPVLYGGLAARLVRRPAVVSAIPGLGSIFTKQGFLANGMRRIVAAMYAQALRHRRSKVIFQNPEDLRRFVDVNNVVASRNAVLIRGAGVDLKCFRALPLPTGIPLVLFASRMLRAKGVEEFVGAAELLRKKDVAARFVLVGEPDVGNPWCIARDALAAWHRGGVVEWWGRRDDMPDVLRQSYMFCLPSYYGEGVPKVLLEAAACGRPLVATDIPGCREIVRPGANGILIPVRDCGALADAIHSLLRDRARAEAMGQRSREIAEGEFSVELVVEQTLELYEELLVGDEDITIHHRRDTTT